MLRNRRLIVDCYVQVWIREEVRMESDMIVGTLIGDLNIFSVNRSDDMSPTSQFSYNI
jgi:hypothetical protein